MRLVLLASLTLASCRVSLESYCDERFRAGCDFGQRCGTVTRAVDCSRRTAVSDCLDGTRSGVETGLVKYDAEAAAACMRGLRTRACDDFKEPVACLDVFFGTALEGEACGSCARGLTCTQGATCGVCAKRPPPVPLPAAPPCVGTISSVTCAPNSACVNGVCVSPGPVGAPCAPGPCEAGTFCDATTSKCARIPEVGEACVFPQLCRSGLTCLEGICVLVGEPGAPCVVASQCRTEVCLEGVCLARSAAGEPCDGTRFCRDELECVAGLCTPRPGEGEACRSFPCAQPLDCVAGVCHDRQLDCR